MVLQRPLPLDFVFSVDERGVSVERNFGINDEMLALGQINNGIGATAAVFCIEAHLPAVVLIQAQSGAVQHILQYQFSPVPLHLFLALERRTQLMSLSGNLLIQLLEMLEFTNQGHLLLKLFMMEILHLGLGLSNLLTERLQQSLQGLL